MNTFGKLKRFGKIGIMAMALVVASCSDDDDNGGGGPSGNAGGFISAKVDGQQFNSLEIQGVSTVVATRTTSMVGELIMIQGSSSDMKSVVINLLGITATGTYTISPENDGSVLAYVETAESMSYDTSNCSGATGTITITKLDSEVIEGTFSFVGKVDESCSQSKNITDGSFRGKFMNAGM